MFCQWNAYVQVARHVNDLVTDQLPKRFLALRGGGKS
jgi:hypothetical protein